MTKILLIGIAVIWLSMFLYPVIANKVRSIKKGRNDDKE